MLLICFLPGNKDTLHRTAERSELVCPAIRCFQQCLESGIVRHLWFTIDPGEPDYLRNLRLRMYWDGRPEPAVDVPFGDFFCLGHGVFEEFSSAPFVLTKAPHLLDPIPFQKSIRVTVEHGHANDAGSSYRSVAYWYGEAAGADS